MSATETIHLPGRSIGERFGISALPGFTPVPDVLVFNQKKLGLNSGELVVLINIMSHWHYATSQPYVRTSTIAKRTGRTQRSIQRIIKDLRDKGFIMEGEPTREGERYDIRPTLEKLEPLARKMLEEQSARAADRQSEVVAASKRKVIAIRDGASRFAANPFAAAISGSQSSKADLHLE